MIASKLHIVSGLKEGMVKLIINYIIPYDNQFKHCLFLYFLSLLLKVINKVVNYVGVNHIVMGVNISTRIFLNGR